MKNVLEDIEDFDKESQRLLRTIAKNGSVLNFHRSSTESFENKKDPFEGIRTNKTFQEISNEIAMDTPFGKNSVFYKELREIITGQIPKL